MLQPFAELEEFQNIQSCGLQKRWSKTENYITAFKILLVPPEDLVMTNRRVGFSSLELCCQREHAETLILAITRELTSTGLHLDSFCVFATHLCTVPIILVYLLQSVLLGLLLITFTSMVSYVIQNRVLL